MAAAADLFYREGFRAVGIDTIVAASGVGKMTLYRHYPSKDDLIVAYLEESHVAFWTWFERSVAPWAGDPRRQMQVFFETLGAMLTATPACHGCPFLNAVVDFPETTHPGHTVAHTNKQSVRDRFRELAIAAGAAQPEILADQLVLLMDGAFMATRTFVGAGPAAHVAGAATALLSWHLDGGAAANTGN